MELDYFRLIKLIISYRVLRKLRHRLSFAPTRQVWCAQAVHQLDFEPRRDCGCFNGWLT